MPNFTPQIIRTTCTLSAMLLVLACLPGCKTDEQKFMESFLAMHEDIVELLLDNAPDADKASQALAEFDAVTKKNREKLNTKMKEALEKLSESERQAFQEEARKRFEEMGPRLEAAVKRYPKERQPELRRRIAPIAR